jgi:hypothetical protein
LVVDQPDVTGVKLFMTMVYPMGEGAELKAKVPIHMGGGRWPIWNSAEGIVIGDWRNGPHVVIDRQAWANLLLQLSIEVGGST